MALAVGNAVLDALEDLHLGLFAKTLELGDGAAGASRLELSEVVDVQLRPEGANLLRPEARNLNNFQ